MPHSQSSLSPHVSFNDTLKDIRVGKGLSSNLIHIWKDNDEMLTGMSCSELLVGQSSYVWLICTRNKLVLSTLICSIKDCWW